MNALTPPPLPTWEGLHPIVVHFPIALLLVAPVFVVISMLATRSTQYFALAALITLALGLGGVFLAVATGDAAEGSAVGAPGFKDVLDAHEELGELTRSVFIGLVGAYALLVAAQIALYDKFPRKARIPVFTVWLLAYLLGCLVLANTAHQGGRLVHEFGVRAKMTASGATPTIPGDPAAPGTPAGDGESTEDRE